MDFESNCERPVRLTVLGDRGRHGDIQANLVSLSAESGRMIVKTAAALPPGTPVKVIFAPYLVLAEIRSATREGDLVLDIQHILKEDELAPIRTNWF